jgi:hypothetical protein
MNNFRYPVLEQLAANSLAFLDADLRLALGELKAIRLYIEGSMSVDRHNEYCLQLMSRLLLRLTLEDPFDRCLNKGWVVKDLCFKDPLILRLLIVPGLKTQKSEAVCKIERLFKDYLVKDFNYLRTEYLFSKVCSDIEKPVELGPLHFLRNHLQSPFLLSMAKRVKIGDNVHLITIGDFSVGVRSAKFIGKSSAKAEINAGGVKKA